MLKYRIILVIVILVQMSLPFLWYMGTKNITEAIVLFAALFMFIFVMLFANVVSNDL